MMADLRHICNYAFVFPNLRTFDCHCFVSDKTALTTSLVITSTIFVAVAAACLWFLYQRRIYSTSGTTCAVHNSTTQLPYGDEVVLLEEENEYVA